MTTDIKALELTFESLLAELRVLERECRDEGGFLTSDPRALRLRALGDEVDDLDFALMCASEGLSFNEGR